MKRKTSLLALLSAGAVTALVVAGFSQAAGSPPSNQSPPTISGTPVDGNTLTAHGGTWTNSPTSTSFQWRRCDQNGASCSSISGATRSTYALKQVDVGNTLRVRETATNSAGSATSTSVPTAVVKAAPQPPPTTLNGCPTSGSGTLAVSAVSPPARLVIDGQAASPSVITRSTEDVTLRFHVAACSGRDVQGALVYATAVPFQQFGVPAEATTDSSGWATITLHRAGHFPASAHQQLLAVFVRARKTGESLLGGISTRRLVSFPVQL